MDVHDITDKWHESYILTKCKVTDKVTALTVLTRYCKVLQMLNYNVYTPISEIFMSESILLAHFEQEIVAKRCEN